jgi:histidyl-tRNA synthetase
VSASSRDLAARQRVAGELRDAGIRVRTDGSARKLGRQLESAAKAGAAWAVIIGEELDRDGRVTLRDLQAAAQQVAPLAEVPALVSRS